MRFEAGTHSWMLPASSSASSSRRQNGIYQLGAALDVFIPHESRDFHVPVVEYVDLDTLPDDGYGNEDGIRSVTTERVSDMCSIQFRQQVEY